jgi:hypothetical protein
MFPRIYRNVTVQFTYELKAEVVVSLDNSQYEM